MLNIYRTVDEIMGLIIEKKKRTRKQFLIIKISWKKGTIKIIILVVVIMVVHKKGESEGMIKS